MLAGDDTVRKSWVAAWDALLVATFAAAAGFAVLWAVHEHYSHPPASRAPLFFLKHW